MFCFEKKISIINLQGKYLGFSQVREEETRDLEDEYREILEYLIQQNSYSSYKSALWDFLRREQQLTLIMS